MNVMTKRGALDNQVTYEHFCDNASDLLNIDLRYITLGSVAVVLKDETFGNSLNIYLANSSKEWIPIGGASSLDENSTEVLPEPPQEQP